MGNAVLRGLHGIEDGEVFGFLTQEETDVKISFAGLDGQKRAPVLEHDVVFNRALGVVPYFIHSIYDFLIDLNNDVRLIFQLGLSSCSFTTMTLLCIPETSSA
jgi:hypothetical protein